MNESNGDIFLTGGTGFIGSYFLKLLLKRTKKRIYVLARGDKKNSAAKRILNSLSFWAMNEVEKYRKEVENLIVLEGDITKKNLGLDIRFIRILESKIEKIFHFAADTKFNSATQRLYEINTVGTENILEFALRCKRKGSFKKINYVSTAFIFGDYQGEFEEDDLDKGQHFNTAYERSKFRAEKSISYYRRKWLWIDIFRPALVVGESVTGKIPSFKQALYQLMHIWNSGIFTEFPAINNHFLYITFVDELCYSMMKIDLYSSEKNRNYHLFNDRPTSLMKIFNYARKILSFNKLNFIPNDANLHKSYLTPVQASLLKYNIFFLNNTKIRLVSKKTNKILKKYNFIFSIINFKNFKNLLDYPIKSGYLKSK